MIWVRPAPGHRGQRIVRPRSEHLRTAGGVTPPPPTGMCPFDGIQSPTIAVPLGPDCGGSESGATFDLALPAHRRPSGQWVATIRTSRPVRGFGARMGLASGTLRYIAAADAPSGDACAEAVSTYHQKFLGLPGEFEEDWICRIYRLVHRGGGSLIEFVQRYCRGATDGIVAPGDLVGRSWAIEPSWQVGGTGYWKNHDGSTPAQHLPLPCVGDVRGRRFSISIAGTITLVPGTLGTSVSVFATDATQVTTPIRLPNAAGAGTPDGPAVAFGPVEMAFTAPAAGADYANFSPHIQVFLTENWRGFNIAVTACSVT